MNYMFIIQGEGRGHLTQAIALSQMLRRNGHTVCEVLVGKCANREIPSFFIEKIGAPVSKFPSPAIDYGKSGKNGRIVKSILLNTTPTKMARWTKSIDKIVSHISKNNPDVIINFYEMLMGIANILHRIKVPVINVAHQFLINHNDFPHRPKNENGVFALRLFNTICSLGGAKTLALSFYPLNDLFRDRMSVVPPLLREDIFKLTPKDDGYLLGYMLNPVYLDDVLAWKEISPETKLHLFWDKKDAPEEWEIKKNLWLHRINDQKFLQYMANCSGYVTTAGFESICEALYLGKPTMMIPSHIEQQVNAKDAHSVGAGIISDSFDISKLESFIPNYNSDTAAFREWVNSAEKQFIKQLEIF